MGDLGQDPASMTDIDVRLELRVVNGELDRLFGEAVDAGPTWVHPPMSEDASRALLRQRRDATPDKPSAAFFLIEGRHQRPEYDDAPIENELEAPDGAVWYTARILRVEPAQQEGGQRKDVEEKHTFLWSRRYDDDGQLVGAGYNHEGKLYETIFDLGRHLYAPRDIYVPAENAERLAALTSLSDRIRDLSVRKDQLMSELCVGVNAFFYPGDGTPVPARLDVQAPRHIEGNLVADFVVEAFPGIRAPHHARLAILDGLDTRVVPTSMPYVEFKKLVALAPSDTPSLLVVEHDHERHRLETGAEAAQDMPDADTQEPISADAEVSPGEHHTLEDAYPVYELGAGFSDKAREIVVWELAGGAGFVVVDAETNEPICGHVHKCTQRELSAKQIQTGRACHLCHEEGCVVEEEEEE